MIRLLFLFILLISLISACEKKDNTDMVDYFEPVISSNNPKEPVVSTNTIPNETIATPSFTQEYMKLINDYRTKLGLMLLIHDEDLGTIATEHSSDMANGNVAFGHSGFSLRCEEARSFLGGGNLCAENVAMGQKTPLAVFNAWLNSPGHRANIEQARSTHTGFGFKKNQSGIYYWTQIFLELD